MNPMRWSGWGIVGWLVLAAPATAAPDTAPEYDLAAVVRLAQQNHPQVIAADAAVKQSAAGLSEARAAALPRLGATLGYAHLQDPPQFRVAPLGTMVFGEQGNVTATLLLQMPLYTGGRVSAQRRQAEALVDAFLARKEGVAQSVALRAAERYFDVLRTQSLIGVMQEQVRALEAQRASVQKMLAAGVVTRIDLLRTEAALASAQEGLVRARAQHAVAQAALAEAIGLPANAPLRVSDRFEAPALPDRLEDAVALAMRNRPHLREAHAGLAAARSAVEAARSAHRPQVAAFVQSDFDRPSYMPRTGTLSAGVTLTYSLFDGNAASAQVEQARAVEAQAAAQQAELENGIRLEVTQRFLEAQSARERITSAQAAVAAAEESHRLAAIGYQNQVTPLTDLLQAQADLTRARSDLLMAQFDLQVARVRLQAAMGG